jgi:phosphoribosylanthranilate isomerase
MLKTFVKVGEINNLSDARYCAGMGVQLLGFVMSNPSRKSLSTEEYIAITQWLEGPKFVGEFIDATDEQILELHNTLSFDYVQTNTSEQALKLLSLKIPTILSLDKNISHIPNGLSYVVIEEEFEGDLASIVLSNEVLLGKGIEVTSLTTLTNDSAFSGIHLKGSDEIRPGFKDFDELADILEALDEA